MKIELIEQLGGYGNAKCELELKEQNSVFQCCIAVDAEMIRDALLQYRRQHSIFEVGDLVICLFGQDSTFLTKDEIYTVKEVCYGGTHVTLKLQENYDGGEGSYSVNRFNHATDEEIKANKRLEVG